MFFTDIFIRRPVFATTLSLLLFCVGLLGLLNLSIREYPRVDSSTVSINISYPGASAQLMETFVT